MNCGATYLRRGSKKAVIRLAVSDTIPAKSRPIVTLWSKAIDREKDYTYPPRNAVLSDCVMYQVISADISTRKRNEFWPEDFDENGNIPNTFQAPA